MLLSHLPVLSTPSGSPPRGRKGLERGALGFCGVLGEGGLLCRVVLFQRYKSSKPSLEPGGLQVLVLPGAPGGPSRGGPWGRSGPRGPYLSAVCMSNGSGSLGRQLCSACLPTRALSSLFFSCPSLPAAFGIGGLFWLGFFCVFSLTLLFGTGSALVFALLMDASVVCLAHSAGRGQSLTRLSARGKPVLVLARRQDKNVQWRGNLLVEMGPSHSRTSA